MVTRTELENKLKKLYSFQELRFWCIYAFRVLPFIGEKFVCHVGKTGYIAALFTVIYTLYSNSSSFSGISVDAKRLKALNEIIRRAINASDFKMSPPVSDTRALLIDLANDFCVMPDSDNGVDLSNLREKLLQYVPNHTKAFFDILIDDVNCILQSSPHENAISFYGDKWDEFLSALKNNSCDYFAGALQRLFNNQFSIDIEDKEYLSNVPIEMFDQGSGAVSVYIYNLIHGSKKLNEARLILLGDKGSGKTSLARRLIDPDVPMTEVEESTPGVDISSFKLREICDSIRVDENANVRMWDFAGHTITHAAHRCFLSERCVYIILCEGRKENVQRLDYWLELVRNYGGTSKIYIVVNIFDQNIVKVDENRIKRDYSDNDCEFYYFSIKEDNKTNLMEFRNEIVRYIAYTPAWSSDIIGLEWFNIKEKLEEKFGNKGIDYISIDDYYDIADKIGAKDKDDALRALSALGICLYYPQIDDLKMVVLDPEWITFGIYDIINWLGNTKKDYKINMREFGEVFSRTSEKYPFEKHSFLYQLMMYYELAYEERKNILVIPQCMETDEPKGLPEFSQEYLQVRFEAKSIDGCQIPFPPDLMPRIIVNRCVEMQNKGSFAWRYGAVLQTQGATGLIFQSGSVLNIKVSGIKATEFNYELYHTIETVIKNYESFQKNKPIFSVLPFLDNGKRGEITPINTINNLARKKQKVYMNPQDNQILDMLKNASAYSPIVLFNPVFNAPSNIANNLVVNQYNDCNFELQGALNEILSQLPLSHDVTQLKEDLSGLIKSLEQNEESSSPQKDAKKTGLWSKLERMGKNISNAESALNTTIRGMKNGKALIKGLAMAYNRLAPLLKVPNIDFMQ